MNVSLLICNISQKKCQSLQPDNLFYLLRYCFALSNLLIYLLFFTHIIYELKISNQKVAYIKNVF